MEDKNFVGNFGLFSTIIVTVVGVGIFSYPREITKFAGPDGWIITIVVGGIAAFLLYLMYKISKLNQYKSFYTILEWNLGKILAKTIGIFFSAYLIFYISIGLRVFSEVTKMYLLEKTPTEFILITMIFVAGLLVRGEIRELVKFNQISFWFMFIPLSIVLLVAISRADFTNLLPVLQQEPMEYFKAMGTTMYSFIGFEIIFLIMPFVNKKEETPKIIFRSMVFIVFFYVLITIVALCIFSKAHTLELLWPTITMIRATEIKGAFVERWEGIVMALWVIFSFTTFTNSFYFAADITKDTFNLKSIKLAHLLLIPFIYGVALYPENLSELYSISSKITPIIATISLIIIPLVLAITSKHRKGREKK